MKYGLVSIKKEQESSPSCKSRIHYWRTFYNRGNTIREKLQYFFSVVKVKEITSNYLLKI